MKAKKSVENVGWLQVAWQTFLLDSLLGRWLQWNCGCVIVMLFFGRTKMWRKVRRIFGTFILFHDDNLFTYISRRYRNGNAYWQAAIREWSQPQVSSPFKREKRQRQETSLWGFCSAIGRVTRSSHKVESRGRVTRLSHEVESRGRVARRNRHSGEFEIFWDVR